MILELELKPSDGANTLNCRRLKRGDDAARNAEEFGSDVCDDLFSGVALAQLDTCINWFKWGEDNAGIRA